MVCMYVQWNNLFYFCVCRKKAADGKASKWWYFHDIWERFFSNPPKNVMTMGLLQRSTFCPCFKLIAVIDCASKMMMSCVLVILLSFQFVVAFCLNLFVSSKNNRRVFGFSFAFFYHFDDIHNYWTRNSFYSIFGFDFVMCFQSCFKLSKT